MKLSPECTAKISSYIGFALKAGKVVFGTDNVLTSNKRMLVIMSDELSGNAAAKISAHATAKGWRVIEISDIGSVIPREGVKVIGIREKNLAETILKLTDGNNE